jgi:alpha-L-fucosidase
LNIGPTGLGGVPAESARNLEAVGAWLAVNGEAVYETEKWERTKEGPTVVNMGGTHAREKEGFKFEFTAADFWFTQKGSTLYAISLVPARGTVMVEAFNAGLGRVKSVELLGHGEVAFKQNKKGLSVELNANLKTDLGYVLKVSL